MLESINCSSKKRGENYTFFHISRGQFNDSFLSFFSNHLPSFVLHISNLFDDVNTVDIEGRKREKGSRNIYNPYLVSIYHGGKPLSPLFHGHRVYQYDLYASRSPPPIREERTTRSNWLKSKRQPGLHPLFSTTC